MQGHSPDLFDGHSGSSIEKLLHLSCFDPGDLCAEGLPAFGTSRLHDPWFWYGQLSEAQQWWTSGWRYYGF